MAANGYALPADAKYTIDSQSPSVPTSAAPAAHQRTYQACIPCRQRKVRCDLGSVDNPHDPPCTRCRRESKECYFSATRRKKKNPNGESAEPEPGDEGVYEIRSNRKRLRMSAPPDQLEVSQDDPYEDQPRTPGGSIGRTQPLRRPAAPKPMQYDEEDRKASEQTAAILQHAELHGGHDALKVLYRAAVHGRADSTTSTVSGPRPTFPGYTSGSLPPATSPMMEKVGNMSYNNGPMAMFQNDNLWKTQLGHAHVKDEEADTIPVDTASYDEAMKAWSRFKFVRAGWFTAKEGMDYILYFFKHLSPLTPVVLPDFKHPGTHRKMLEEEPTLAVTMLLIASRHMKLEGPGSNSRPFAIHHKLWQHLSGMIDRVVWGQEQFGGGFCGAGAQPGCDVNPLTRKGLRTLGTVESLVLLTEWHPRAMHFPPDEDDDDIMLPDISQGVPDVSGDHVLRGIGGHRMDAWLEPCWRSDRMCWMLLGMAMSLAMEIGVFDASEWQRHAPSADGGPLSAEDLSAYNQRRGCVRNLLLVYVTQTSGRLGLTSMLPGYYSTPEDSDLFKRPPGVQQDLRETTLHFWLRMAALMKEGNNKIFANKSFTRDLIRNGNYKAALEQFQAPLREWRKDFDACISMPKNMRSVLEIEYEYCRVYLNALALQAVAERCANDHPSPVQVVDPPMEMARSAAANGVRTDPVISPATLSKWLSGDRKYIQIVGDAARNLLKVVVDDLNPDGSLSHAPVRTYFRIISVAIMLLKTFSLGATESDTTDSLTLMDRTVDALRSCIVDDVHVASRFADLLDTLTQTLKPRLVRIAADGRNHRSRHVSHRSSHSPRPTSAPHGNNVHQTPAHATMHQQSTPTQTPSQPNWEHSNALMPPTITAHGSNPMYGISNDSYDLMGSDNPYSVMPPPGFSTNSPNGAMNNMPTGGSSGSYDQYSNFDSQDWFTLPLDPLLNMSSADVTQTMYGPDISGQDMLELLLGNSSNGNQY